MLADPASLGNASSSGNESLFDPQFWAARGALEAVSGGRGSAWFIGSLENPWVLRHYRRGGLVAQVLDDRYLWCGENRVRAFAEWRLLEFLREHGMPVPKPVAAWYRRVGCGYRCDLIIQRIADTHTLSEALAAAALREEAWSAIGQVIARLHRLGVDHADLNAHNVLLDSRGTVSLIDFDRGRVRRPGAWAAGNLDRLHHSLEKVAARLPPDRFPASAWTSLLGGYRAPL